MIFFGQHLGHGVDAAVMEVEESNLAADVERFCVIVDGAFFLVHDDFADRNDEVHIDHINLIEYYDDVFVDIEEKFDAGSHDLTVFSSQPSLIVFELG